MYSRETELRHLRSNHVFTLAQILDQNNCWKKLIEKIPKVINAQECSADGTLKWVQTINPDDLKYNSDHIHLLESAKQRSGEDRPISQILIDEWSTSGRKNERPTVGVLLQLLMEAELFRAAEYVATEFLNEERPQRPETGPAAPIDTSLPNSLFNDVNDYANGSDYYPNTDTLQNMDRQVNSVSANNKDYYEKYRNVDKNILINDGAPKRPPRSRPSRIQNELQQQGFSKATSTMGSHLTNATINEEPEPQSTQPSDSVQRYRGNAEDNDLITSHIIPKFSKLINASESTDCNGLDNACSTNLENTDSSISIDAPMPNISLLLQSPSIINSSTSSGNEVVPSYDAHHFNGEYSSTSQQNDESSLDQRNSSSNSSSSLSNVSIEEDMELPVVVENMNKLCSDNEDDDDKNDDDDDNSNQNLNNFEQRSSNNDSSLTTVTGTSGDNSFELSMNDYSSGSN